MPNNQTESKVWDNYLEDLRGVKAVPENDMVEKVARALAYHDYDTEDVWESHVSCARAAIQAMRDYSEAMSQAGGYVPKMQYGDPMPVGQSIAERCYLAMIDAALQPSHKQGE